MEADAPVSKAWWPLAFRSGMRPCVLCGEPTGRGCPCGEVVCFKCSVAVDVAISEGNTEGRIAWRCKRCAAELVLTGQGRPHALRAD